MPTPIPPTPIPPTPLPPTPLPADSPPASRSRPRSRTQAPAASPPTSAAPPKRRPTAASPSAPSAPAGPRPKRIPRSAPASQPAAASKTASRRRSSRRKRSGSNGGFGPSRLSEWFAATGWKDDRLGAVCDVCLLFTLLVTPWVMGGRIAAGQLAFQAGGFAAGAALCVRSIWGRGFSIRPSDCLLGVGLAVVALQVTPLPASLVNTVSPKIAELLPALGDAESRTGLPAWNRLSLVPAETWRHLGLLAAGVLYYITLRNRLDTPRRQRAALWVVSGLGGLLAAFGIVQYALDNGRFFWFYDYPFTTPSGRVRGPYSNPNHFAGWMVLASVWPLWTAIAPGRQRKDDFGKVNPWPLRAALAVLSLTIPAVLLSQSRSGLVTFGVAVTCVFVLGLKGRGPNSGRRLAFSAAALAIVGAVSLAAFGADAEAQVEQNLLELTSADLDDLDRNNGRRAIWATAVKGFRDFPLLGVGLGGHLAVYPHYWDGPAKGKRYTHAENGPLQLALETGVAGLAVVGLFAACVLFVLMRAFRGEEAFNGQRVILGAALTMAAAHGIHTLTDFVWHAPGNMLAVLSVLAAGTAAASRAEARTGGLPPRAFGFAGAAGVALAAGLSLPPAAAWASAQPHVFESRRLRDRLDGEVDRETYVQTNLLELRELLAARRHVTGHPEIDGRLATLMLRVFDLRQRESGGFNLANLRDSSRGGGWDSVEALNGWLSAEGVAGGNFQGVAAARSLALATLRQYPMELSAWRRVFATQFIADLRPDAGREVVAQMLAAQPHAAQSHHEAAVYALYGGDQETAVEHWLVAFRQNAKMRPTVAQRLALMMPAERLLEETRPDARSLHELQGIYEAVGRPDEEGVLARALGQEWEMAAAEAASADAVEMLRRACIAYRKADDAEAAERAGLRAVEQVPTSVSAHTALGDFYRSQARWAEASEHLLWCSRMRPDDPVLYEKAAFCLKKARERATLVTNPDDVIIR